MARVPYQHINGSLFFGMCGVTARHRDAFSQYRRKGAAGNITNGVRALVPCKNGVSFAWYSPAFHCQAHEHLFLRSRMDGLESVLTQKIRLFVQSDHPPKACFIGVSVFIHFVSEK